MSDDPFLTSTRPARSGRNGDGRSAERRSTDGRVPPHNLGAEEAVLGAILLSRDALGSVIEAGLRYDDFYKPAHQHIYDVATAVSQSGAPADTITVADELQRLGLLESIGGVETLHRLQNATPAISNAAHYAKIVADAAMLRRLIMVAGDISELAYSGPDNVDMALDEAETKVFKVADRRVSDTYAEIGELMKGAIERIEENYARGDTITGIPTGYADLDELLSGLQPSTLNIIGARPAMGKCLAWDTPIVHQGSGEVLTAAELFDRAAHGQPVEVLSLGGDGRLGTRRVSACLDDGVRPVFKVTTRSGRTVTITECHPLLTARGWKPLFDVQVGEPIAMPASVPVFGNDDLPDEAIDLLALLIGDGSVSGTHGSPRLTTASTAVADLALLRHHGVWGETAHGKRFPRAIFRLPRHRLARFLNRLFATDGTAWVAQAGYARIGYCSVSEQLARDVQHALTRFGIRTKLRERQVKYKEGRRRAFEVEVMDAPSLLKFCDEIGIVGKEAAVARVRARAADAQHQFSLDVVPAEVWDDIDKARGDLSWAEVTRRCGKSAGHNWHRGRRGPLRRETVAALAAALDDERLRWWSSPDIAWDRIVSIEPAGETRVIDFTVPSTHNFVAADLYLHNTALGLGIATNVAKLTSKPVLVFSLEMGHIELTQRILSSEAEVDSTKIRNGRLSESDWAKVGRAIGRLEVPLFLDDNPRVTVMEIRAKARRLKMQRGDIGLVLIDYLQLMSGGGNAENRQLEVSEISRNLKILARELEVPIIALSQLSRNLEQRADKKPMLSDLRESGCLTADTRLLRADTNAEVTLGELVESGARDVPVWSLDRDLKMTAANLRRAFPSGVKEVFRLRLASGREVDASANHPFLTVGGWLRLDELCVGSRIAVPRLVPPPLEPESWPDDEVILLAHLLGDGCFASRQPIHYTSGDPANIEAVDKAARAFGIEGRRVVQRSYDHLYLSAGRGLGRGRRNPIAAWLGELGLYGLRSHEKFIPDAVFALETRQVALFLRHLWATDGSLGVYRRGRGDAASVYYASNSRRLIDGVRLLLSRFGILTTIVTSQKGEHRTGYQLHVQGAASMRTFLDRIGVHGRRGERVRLVRARVAATTKEPYTDALPAEVSERVLAAIAQSGLSMSEVSRRAGLGRYLPNRAPVPRSKLALIADVLNDDFLRMLAESDVHWDRVIEIEPLGAQPVFDATVDETHNFVANGITVENSLEQDADVVMFLYRDEVYNKESPDRGSADLIVAKHRAGPIGEIRLAFRGHYAKFDSAAPSYRN